mmetsp:Transcript_15912/g.36236  ORF Transcript_15912/g.36236 Transcript_15912/m.36236 type:complete len:342 (-) Transcript_15912:358-1383(-)
MDGLRAVPRDLHCPRHRRRRRLRLHGRVQAVLLHGARGQRLAHQADVVGVPPRGHGDAHHVAHHVLRLHRHRHRLAHPLAPKLRHLRRGGDRPRLRPRHDLPLRLRRRLPQPLREQAGALLRVLHVREAQVSAGLVAVPTEQARRLLRALRQDGADDDASGVCRRAGDGAVGQAALRAPLRGHFPLRPGGEEEVDARAVDHRLPGADDPRHHWHQPAGGADLGRAVPSREPPVPALLHRADLLRLLARRRDHRDADRLWLRPERPRRPERRQPPLQPGRSGHAQVPLRLRDGRGGADRTDRRLPAAARLLPLEGCLQPRDANDGTAELLLDRSLPQLPAVP